MMRHAFEIELIDDCIFSARSATEGGHESLTRVPGATLLGAAASQLYRSLDPRDAWAAFHSGKLRFGDGLPFAGGRIGYPIPLCWHRARNAGPHPAEEKVKRLHSEHIYNFMHTPCIKDGDEVQPKQMRSGYIFSDGLYFEPKHAFRLKTAIDVNTGRAADAQLFGYDALARGQRFVACIEAGPEFDRAIFKEVIKKLSGQVLLGRSRSAEYGRVLLTPVKIELPVPVPLEGESATLWLLSDLALVDVSGAPTLTPCADTLGIPGAQVDWRKTFLRSRRYSPWNAARHGYDRERLVLAAGGVITLQLAKPLDKEAVLRLSSGLGLYREAGFGRLWLNSPLLVGEHPEFEEAGGECASSKASRPDHPLIEWLEKQSSEWRKDAEGRGEEFAAKYWEQVGKARRAAGVPATLPFGPSKSQWARVLEAARNRTGQRLFDSLFTGDAAVIKSKAEGWEVEIPDGKGRWRRLAEWLKDELAPGGDDRAYAHWVRNLAHRVHAKMDQRRV